MAASCHGNGRLGLSQGRARAWRRPAVRKRGFQQNRTLLRPCRRRFMLRVYPETGPDWRRSRCAGRPSSVDIAGATGGNTSSMISVVIPTYKRHAVLRRALESIAPLREAADEVVVVDQSPDAHQQKSAVKKDFPFIAYLCLPSPGLPASRNMGVFTTRGDIILFVDDDIIMDKNCIRQHLNAHRRDGVHVVAGRIRQMRGAQWAPAETVAAIDPDTGVTTGNFDLDYEGFVEYATGGHMSVKRDVFRRVGLFNTRFRGNALFEDIDFSCRVTRKGLGIWYNPRAMVHHHPQDAGGCHASHGASYLLDRLYNHTLFYFLNIARVPSRAFLEYQKNLAEFISRDPSGGHRVTMLLRCLAMACRAYSSGIMTLCATWSRPSGMGAV
ncbi:MAG: glycosyltransferase [Chitinivibrionales bacterium]|nr:glycosyltransferase [Chitinivibrionales bacterium]MBD3395716.1 glycosyltransferase [Chitinivibrionales bacterium]